MARAETKPTKSTIAAAPTQRFGAHMSIAGGLHLAFELGHSAGCDCLQIFVKNQRQWVAKPLDDASIAAFTGAWKQSSIAPIVAHATYLINLAAADGENRQKSIRATIDELERCEALGLLGLVLHPGAHLGAGVDEGIRRIATALDEIHKATAGFKTRVLLENTAGQGSTIGSKPAELRCIIDGVKAPERLGACIDTCHLFAAGYDLRDAEKYADTIGEIDSTVGLKQIACLHVNDSKAGLGSHLDRHEHIGEGQIGQAGFVRLLNDPRLAHIPRILETDKGDDGRSVELDVKNLSTLRGYVGR